MPKDYKSPTYSKTAAYWAAGVYACLGGLRILFSEPLLKAMASAPDAYHSLRAYERWLYLAATTGLLYVLVRYAITRIEKLEQEKRSSEAHFRDLVEESLIGVYIIQDHLFTYVNARFAEIFGYAKEEIVGNKSPLELVAPQDRELVAENIRKRVNDEVASVRYGFRGLRKNGEPVDVEVLGTRTEFGGRPAVVGMLLDQTERNLLQKEFLHAQKMELVGRLAGGVAHDFNNILTAIMGLSQMTAASLPKEDQRRADVEEIFKCSQRAAALTRQLLTFSRKQLIQPRLLDLNALIDDAQKMLRRAAGEGVALELCLAESLRKIKADPGQIEQVLMNLVVNARDAMPRGGTISVTTSNVDVPRPLPLNGRQMPAGAYVLLTIRDTGQGMEEDTLAHIFEPFFTTKEPGKGTGLGLSVVQSIVEQGGGRVAVESRPGEGTLFRIYLPKAPEPEAAAAAPTQPHPDRRGSETILLVDDEREVRQVLRRVLEGHGYTVLCAEGYDDAVSAAERRQDKIDLLVTDTLMPGKGGPDLAEKMKSLHPEAKVLFISGHSEEGVVRSRIIDQNQPFLPKPFTFEAFLDKVRATIDA